MILVGEEKLLDIKDWEEEVYDEIMEAYHKRAGALELSNFEETFVYREITKLMRKLKGEYKDKRDVLKEVITNALLLIITLFLNEDDDDDFDEGRELSSQDQKYLKSLFSHAIDVAESKAAVT